MIIVEGPDGGGKTTLVNRLCKDLSTQVRPRACTSDNGPVGDLLGWVNDDLDTNIDVGIYDRHPLVSEFIYGPILRGETLLGQDDRALGQVVQRFRSARPFIIYCLPPLAYVRTNVAQSHTGETEHLRGVLKYTDALWSAYYYRYVMDRFSALAVRWDYTGETTPVPPNTRYAQILHIADTRRDHAAS